MRRPTDTALKSRARALLEAMTARARWIYAVPRDDGPTAVRERATAAGLQLVAEDAAAGTARWANAAGSAAVTTTDRPELDVIVVEATGAEAPPVLAAVLEQAGFYAQSTLLGSAHDLHDEEAAEALATLATMVVAWDAGWKDLFALHLGATDPVVRREAALSLGVAARTAGEPGAARGLLEEALRRERDEAVAEKMKGVLEAL